MGKAQRETNKPEMILLLQVDFFVDSHTMFSWNMDVETKNEKLRLIQAKWEAFMGIQGISVYQ